MKTVRQEFNKCCLVTNCRRDGCSVDLRGIAHPYLLVDFDSRCAPFKQHETRCDYLLIGEGNPALVVPIELTRGRKKQNILVRQLQAGAEAAESVLPDNLAVQFQPVLVGKSKKYNLSSGREPTVSFRGKSEGILKIDCGGVLKDALRKAK